ncbi:glycosyltransferase family 4 protein [Candidatus Omnitrophota bacterium]
MIKKKKHKKTKLNIAQLHWGFPPIIGGVETHLDMILPMMVQLGHRVSLLTGAVEGVKARYKYKGINIFRSPLMDLNWLYKRGLHGLEEEITMLLRNFFDSIKPDVIHCHNMHYFSLVHAKIVEREASARKIPLILTAHNVWDEMLFLQLSRKINWTRIIAVSHFIKKELIGVGCNDRKITVVHHGIDTKEFHPKVDTKEIEKKYPQLKGKRIIFHPARMGLAKGCDTSIKAFKIIKDRFPNTMLVLAGTKHIIDWGETQQKDIAYLVRLVKIFKLEKHVLIDVYSRREVSKLYGLSDVCLYPSTGCEPFGLTMLEALATAKPMVVTNAGGMPEIIRDGINGFVVPIRDFEALASRVIQLLANDNMRRRLGETGREIVLEYYKKEDVTRNTINVYRRAIEEL